MDSGGRCSGSTTRCSKNSLLQKVPQAPGYCDEELVVEEDERLDDFHMAAVSWLLLKEWDNSMWSEKARNSLLARLIILPWWLDEQGLDTTSLLFLLRRELSSS